MDDPIHYPAIAAISDGSWLVYCTACSAENLDYTYPCRDDWEHKRSYWPPRRLINPKDA